MEKKFEDETIKPILPISVTAEQVGVRKEEEGASVVITEEEHKEEQKGEQDDKQMEEQHKEHKEEQQEGEHAPVPTVHDTSEVEEKKEDSAAAGETTALVEEQEEEQKEAPGSVPTCVMNNWYLKRKKKLKGNVTNHPTADKGSTFLFTLLKSDRQRHLKTGLTIHSTTGRPYLLGAPKSSKKEKEEKQS